MTDEMHVRYQTIDLGELQEQVRLGVRRAAAFLGIAYNSTMANDSSVLLSQHSSWRFFPDPMPADALAAANQEFRTWVTGNALRELDAFFSVFLDGAWIAIQLGKLHGTKVAPDHQIKGIESDTNIARKLKRVLAEVGAAEEDVKYLRPLSDARNSLSHNHGIVARRHANQNGVLELCWLGLETRIGEGEDSVLIDPQSSGVFRSFAPSSGIRVNAQIIGRRKAFAVGERIALEPDELHEICFTVSGIADRLIQAILTLAAARGARPARGADEPS